MMYIVPSSLVFTGMGLVARGEGGTAAGGVRQMKGARALQFTIWIVRESGSSAPHFPEGS